MSPLLAPSDWPSVLILYCPQPGGPGGWALAFPSGLASGHALQTTPLALLLDALPTDRVIPPAWVLAGSVHTLLGRREYGLLGAQLPVPLSPPDQALWPEFWMRTRTQHIGWELDPDTRFPTLARRARESWAQAAQRVRTARLRAQGGIPVPPGSGAPPADAPLPFWARRLGFLSWPTSLAMIRQAFRHRVFQDHPDYGGSVDQLRSLLAAKAAAETWWRQQYPDA